MASLSDFMLQIGAQLVICAYLFIFVGIKF